MSMTNVVKECDWLNIKPTELVSSLILSGKVRADTKARMRWIYAINWMKSQLESYVSIVLYIRTCSRIAYTDFKRQVVLLGAGFIWAWMGIQQKATSAFMFNLHLLNSMQAIGILANSRCTR